MDWLSSIFSSNYPLVSVKSTIDGRTYRVRDLSDKQEAANLMANTRIKIASLCNALQQKYPDKKQVQMISQNFRDDPNRFLEATPDAAHTSYSVNKGEKVYMCLRQRNEKEELVDENIITFVAIHELAHIGTPEIGHTPSFWNNFGWLLKEAEAMKVYEFTNFAAHPVEYCGIRITDQPTYKKEKDVDPSK